MNANPSKAAVIIVTHNSDEVIGPCLEAVAGQTAQPGQVIVVDSGSRNKKKLTEVKNHAVVSDLISVENVGFARANNIGMAHVGEEIQYVLFLNPDTCLQKDSICQAIIKMESEVESGIVTGRLSGYDFKKNLPTGRLDSTGIFRTWYGRWYDRGQGEKDEDQYSAAQDVPAACGALMFCRKKALLQSSLKNGCIFDEDFFLYKEDIELCIRIRKTGWRVRYIPGIKAFHGRGWQAARRRMSRELRKSAARSEILLYKKHPSPYMLWAAVKYFLVVIFDV